ncbi:MAG: hypothetical protein HYX36_06005 [Rhizobiales bacterium]|nr:hypothetical protein [Hyphomicrobiales bacterium]
MQKKTIAIAAGVAALIAVAGVAGLAQAQMGFGWRPHHPMGEMLGSGGPIGARLMMRNFIERYDAGKTGKITQAEIDQNRTAWFNDADVAKKGSLTLDQYQALWLREHRLEMVRAFQFLDRNGDGQLTLDEYRAPFATIVADLDRNNDGSLGRDDRPARGPDGKGPWARFRHPMGGNDGGSGGEDRGDGQ